MLWPPANGCPPQRRWSAHLQDLSRHFGIELAHRPTEDGDGHQRVSAHGVDVADGVGRRDAPKGAWVVYDGHEEVRGGDGRRPVPEVIDRRVIAGPMAHEQVWVVRLRAELTKNAVEHTGGNLAAATGTVAELRQPDGILFHAQR